MKKFFILSGTISIFVISFYLVQAVSIFDFFRSQPQPCTRSGEPPTRKPPPDPNRPKCNVVCRRCGNKCGRIEAFYISQCQKIVNPVLCGASYCVDANAKEVYGVERCDPM